jgi:hypothetical protein
MLVFNLKHIIFNTICNLNISCAFAEQNLQMKCSIQSESKYIHKHCPFFSVDLVKKDTEVKKVAHYFERLPMHPLHLFGNYSTFCFYLIHANISVILCYDNVLYVVISPISHNSVTTQNV